MGSSNIVTLGDNAGSQDVKSIVSSSVFTAHINVYSYLVKSSCESLTKLRDGTVQRNVSDFLIHIVDSSSRLISEVDTVGLDDSLVLFKDLNRVSSLCLAENISYFADAEDFTLSSLKLVESSSLEPRQL